MKFLSGKCKWSKYKDRRPVHIRNFLGKISKIQRISTNILFYSGETHYAVEL